MNFTTKARAIASGAAFCFSLSGPALAQGNDWDFTGYLYLWGPALGGSTTTGQDIDISFSDILDNLDFGLMGALEARKDRLYLFADFLYLNMSNDENAAFGPGIPATADVDVKGTVFTGLVGYDIFDTSNARFSVAGGLRANDIDTTANIAIAGGSQRVKGGINNWDAIVGVRGTTRINDRWQFSYYADVGAGDSELTWQASTAFDYRINNWDLSFGYRYLTWDIDDSSVVTDLTFDGPFIGAKVQF